MSTPAEMAERHGRVMAELAGLGLTLARSLHEQALAAESAQEACDLGLAFHRISRLVRQSLALEAGLERDRRRSEQAPLETAPVETPPLETGEGAGPPESARLLQRTARVRAAVERIVWDEAERPEAGDPSEAEFSWDELAAEREAVSRAPVEVQVERLRADLDLPARAPGAARNFPSGPARGRAQAGWPPPAPIPRPPRGQAAVAPPGPS